jgi:hypothetical protein
MYILADARHALRLLARSPIFTITARRIRAVRFTQAS